MSKQISTKEDLRNSLEKLKPQIKAALPAHISVEKFSRVLMTAISTTPALVEAERNSLFGACLKLAQQGLMPDGQEAAIVTFRTKGGGVTATAMPMTKGILKLVRNSGELASITPNVVYENDEFDYWVDENGDHLKHRPNLKDDRGSLTHAYAVAKTKDGAVYIEVMSKAELDKVRNASRSKDGGPWSSWYEEMARKTVIRRLSKRLPMSTDLDAAVTADDEMYDLNPEPQAAPPPAEKPAKKSRLKKLVEDQEVIEAEPVQNDAPPTVDETEELPL